MQVICGGRRARQDRATLSARSGNLIVRQVRVPVSCEAAAAAADTQRRRQQHNSRQSCQALCLRRATLTNIININGVVSVELAAKRLCAKA